MKPLGIELDHVLPLGRNLMLLGVENNRLVGGFYDGYQRDTKTAVEIAYDRIDLGSVDDWLVNHAFGNQIGCESGEVHFEGWELEDGRLATCIRYVPFAGEVKEGMFLSADVVKALEQVRPVF